jgi:hypothetical protein
VGRLGGEVTMKIATILLGILDIAAAIVVTVVVFNSLDPAFFNLDTFVLWTVPILCFVTAVPAVLLALKSQWRKSALLLALGFPVGFIALVVGVFVYFTYFL